MAKKVDLSVNGQTIEVNSNEKKTAEKRTLTYADRFKKWQEAEKKGK